MAHPEPQKRSHKPAKPTNEMQTVFVDNQRRNAAGRTLTRSDKDSVFKIS